MRREIQTAKVVRVDLDEPLEPVSVEPRYGEVVLVVRSRGTVIGQAVLPCFVGDSLPELRRMGTTIDELADQQWMVLNDAERHQPAVRLAIDRLVALLEEHRALFRGERPAA